VQQANNDPLKAAATLEALRKKAPTGSSYENRLKEAVAFLKKNPSTDDMKAFVGRIQHGYELHKPYANAKSGEVTKP
jgi:hypothetical protein